MLLLNVLVLLEGVGCSDKPSIGPIRADSCGCTSARCRCNRPSWPRWHWRVGARRAGPQGSAGRLTGGNWLRPLFPVVGVLFVLVGYNDLGTMMCLVVLLVGMLWAAGVRLRVFVALFAVAMVGIGAGRLAFGAGSGSRDAELPAWPADHFLHPPSRNMLERLATRSGQARYAIANGGWFGVGLGEGSSSGAGCPRRTTTSSSPIIAEELGRDGLPVVLVPVRGAGLHRAADRPPGG